MGSSVAAAPPADATTELRAFETSAFCKQYGCTNHQSWALSTGGTNHSYDLNLTPAVSIEVPTKDGRIEHYGLSFSERDRLSEPQLHVIDALLTNIDATTATGDVRQFVRANIEHSVFQIRLSKSTRFGRYRLWAGKVGDDKIVSIEPVASPEGQHPVVAAAAGSSKTATAAPSDLVSFKVAAQYSTVVVLLVPANTTDADLTKLVYALRTARTNGTLDKFLPPTTPGGSKGPFAIVWVFVMSDPMWATTPKLKSFSNPTTSGITAAEKEFGKRVLAYYYFTSIMNQEFGTIGYADEGHQYTEKYRKLF